MKKMKTNKGITLIALVITIIVLLILAGVSIATLTGDNGILKQAEKTKELTEVASEKEAIDLSIASFHMNSKIDSNEANKLGIALYDKTIENGNLWNVVVNKQDNKTYGTGWNYIEKNDEINSYGKTKYSWLINYTEGKSIQLEDNKYIKLSYKDNIAITNGLIFNIDPSIISGNDKDSIEQELGENIELKNFNWNEESGLTKSSFNFDGIDDYITIKYNKEEEKDQLAKNGFTFEFYGIINPGNSYNNNQIIQNGYKGIFCYWNGIESNQANFRFGITSRNTFYWNAGFDNNKSDYSNSSTPWNIEYPLNDWKYGDKAYFTITVDTSNSYIKEGVEYYKHIVYMNGTKLYEGGYNKKTWEAFINNELPRLSYFCLGRSSMTENGWWHYTKLNTYTLRLYNRALTKEEVLNNYNTSTTYHDLLTKE